MVNKVNGHQKSHWIFYSLKISTIKFFIEHSLAVSYLPKISLQQKCLIYIKINAIIDFECIAVIYIPEISFLILFV